MYLTPPPSSPHCCCMVCAVTLMNTQVVLQGIEQPGYVLASSHITNVFGCDHEPRMKNGVDISKKSWVGKIQELQVCVCVCACVDVKQLCNEDETLFLSLLSLLHSMSGSAILSFFCVLFFPLSLPLHLLFPAVKLSNPSTFSHPISLLSSSSPPHPPPLSLYSPSLPSCSSLPHSRLKMNWTTCHGYPSLSYVLLARAKLMKATRNPKPMMRPT